VPGDKREKPRRRTYLGGRVVQDDGISIACVIRNVSASGAMIEVPPLTTVPDEWTLLDMKHALAHRVVVRWRKDTRLGVRFARSWDLQGDIPSNLYHLQRLWAAERQVRGDGSLSR
jgi:hypothetical protein